jgi:hypothetical protein
LNGAQQPTIDEQDASQKEESQLEGASENNQQDGDSTSGIADGNDGMSLLEKGQKTQSSTETKTPKPPAYGVYCGHNQKASLDLYAAEHFKADSTGERLKNWQKKQVDMECVIRAVDSVNYSLGETRDGDHWGEKSSLWDAAKKTGSNAWSAVKSGWNAWTNPGSKDANADSEAENVIDAEPEGLLQKNEDEGDDGPADNPPSNRWGSLPMDSSGEHSERPCLQVTVTLDAHPALLTKLKCAAWAQAFQDNGDGMAAACVNAAGDERVR